MTRFRCSYGKTGDYTHPDPRQTLSKQFDQRLSALGAVSGNPLAGALKGIEKESLRIDANGYLSQQHHPDGLGSALTNRYITTDFSEALLEFVTPAFANTWEALHLVCDIHKFTYERLGDELIWVASMPCRIPTDADIPIANYGSSNVGQMKAIYRRGLGHRYGRQMQTIAGVHFNYSLAEAFWPVYQQMLGTEGNECNFRSEQYLALVRNFQRMSWITLYLFGSSPAICKSFDDGLTQHLSSLNAETAYEPFATSLRMSDIGYSNQNQAQLNISLNSLGEYIRDLSEATLTPHPEYAAFGIKVDGEYQQLNANYLQIENEYYSSVRPKRVARTGERPTAALQRGGIEYVEIRSLDINTFDPCGINQNTMRFVEAFLVYCLLEESPYLDCDSSSEAARNQTGMAKRGRDPEFRLIRDGNEVSVSTWATEILQKVAGVAELIDRDSGSNSYAESVQVMQAMVDNPEATPSARLLQEMIDEDCSFFELALDFSRSHRDYFASIGPLQNTAAAIFNDEVTRSLQEQREIEATDDLSLDEYLANYFSGDGQA